MSSFDIMTTEASVPALTVAAVELELTPPPTPSDVKTAIASLQTSLISLSTPFVSLTTTLTTSTANSLSDSTSSLSSAIASTSKLVSFLYSHPPTSVDISLNGQLQSDLGSLFGAFAIAESTAACSASSLPIHLSDLVNFEKFSVLPLESLLESLHTRVESEKEGLEKRIEALKAQMTSVEDELSKKTIARDDSEQQLKELTKSIDALHGEIETFEAEKAALERKLNRQRERRRAQGSAAAAGSFFSVFAPVFVPLTLAPAAPSALAKEKLHTLTTTLDNLRHQLTGLSPSSITDLHTSLVDACTRLTAVHTNMITSLTTLTTELEDTENYCETLFDIEHELRVTLRKIGDLRAVVEKGKRRLEEMEKMAQSCKWEIAQAIVTTGRMGLMEARGYVLAPLRTVCGVLQGVEGVEEIEDVLEKVVRGEWFGMDDGEVGNGEVREAAKIS